MIPRVLAFFATMHAMNSTSHRQHAVIIGAGMMGRWHADALRRSGRAIAAVIDADIDAARALARRLGAAAYATLEEMPPGVGSAAHLCTPPHTRANLIRAALQRGWHVISEKPLGMTLDETRALYTMAEERGLRLMPVYQMPFQRGAQRAFAGIARAGAILRVDMRFFSAGADHGGDAESIARDIMAHPLSVLSKIGARPPNLCLYPQKSDHRDAARAGEIALHTVHDGMMIVIHVSMNARPTRADVEIAGTRGTWWIDLYHGYSVFFPGGVSRLAKATAPFTRSARIMGSAAANLIHRGLAGETAFPGLRALIDGFYRALQPGGVLPIPRAQGEWIAAQRDSILNRDER